jgi:outer membrane lipoprotein-sorting protein
MLSSSTSLHPVCPCSRRLRVLVLIATTLALSVCPVSAATPVARTNPSSEPRVMPVTDLLAALTKASESFTTLTADFRYSVNSARHQQLVVGKVRLMKPNFARLTFEYIAEPAFANVVAADGERVYTFKPDRKPPFNPTLAAARASGFESGGGRIEAKPATADGEDVRLWDGIAIQAFFNPAAALTYLYLGDEMPLTEEKAQTIDGVVYKVIHHHFEDGNIAGGEKSPFEQRLYIGPDGLIHQYVLEFMSAGARGTQIMRLTNIQTNQPMTRESFAFAPPTQSGPPLP